MASLFVIRGRDQGKRFEIDQPAVGLGRDVSNDIQLQDTEVSRKHAELRHEDGRFSLVDLHSSNGSFVNDEQVQSCDLRSGDRIRFGRTLMIFTGSEETSRNNLADLIHIVTDQLPDEDSRIVQTISQQESSSLFSGIEHSNSPWLARARSNLQIMYRTALAVSHTLDIDQLLHRILELIFEWVETDRGCILLVDQGTDALEPKVHRDREGIQKDTINISRRILDYVMQNKEGVLTSDASEDQRWDPGGSIMQTGVREAICVPMQGRYGVVGVIYIDTFTPPGHLLQHEGGRPERFTDEHLKLMVAIAHQAALAVEDTSYYSAMVQAERLAAVGQAITTLSHHIKNILQGIRGGSYLIEEGLKSDERDVVQKGWDIVDKNQEKISNLVLDMLTFSKEREPELVASDLNQVAADVVELVQNRATHAATELQWIPDTNMPLLTFDPEGIHRAILNVVANALDACEGRQDAAVKVFTNYLVDEGVAHVVIEDNGVGIAVADLNKVFTMFESKKGGHGTGLGLPVSQKILREHGGEIQVDSTPEVGSRFVLELPAILGEFEGHTMVPRTGEISPD